MTGYQHTYMKRRNNRNTNGRSDLERRIQNCTDDAFLTRRRTCHHRSTGTDVRLPKADHVDDHTWEDVRPVLGGTIGQRKQDNGNEHEDLSPNEVPSTGDKVTPGTNDDSAEEASDA